KGVSTVSDYRYSNCFGLTEEEVARVLEDFGLSGTKDTFQEWYDGYLFGDRASITFHRFAKPKL
ncbi:MAG: hypothetical protein LBC41_06530, partial [Clostridiales bacterium]|nr:hypothetical protein [Clostridiales bacterium]